MLDAGLDDDGFNSSSLAQCEARLVPTSWPFYLTSPDLCVINFSLPLFFLCLLCVDTLLRRTCLTNSSPTNRSLSNPNSLQILLQIFLSVPATLFYRGPQPATAHAILLLSVLSLGKQAAQSRFVWSLLLLLQVANIEADGNKLCFPLAAHLWAALAALRTLLWLARVGNEF